MNLELVKELEIKYHLGELHDEKYLPQKGMLKINLFKALELMCACNVTDEDVEVKYDYSLEIGNAKRINNKIRELEAQGKTFEALVQVIYSATIDAKEATQHRKNRNVEVFPTDWENYLAELTMLMQDQQLVEKLKAKA